MVLINHGRSHHRGNGGSCLLTSERLIFPIKAHRTWSHPPIKMKGVGLSCHIWSCHILSKRTKYDCNIWSGQNMTTNLLVIFRPPLQYFVRPTNSILRLPYHAWDHMIRHNCKGRRNRSEFVIIFCPDQILQS